MKRMISIALAIAMMIFVCVGLTGCNSGDQTKTPNVLESESFTLKEGQTAVVTKDGVIVDFGCLLEASIICPAHNKHHKHGISSKS